MAKLYIRNYYAPSTAIQFAIRRKIESLASARSNISLINEGLLVYNQSYIYIRPDHAESDAVVANYLKTALALLKSSRIEEAETSLERAKDMSPNYFEVYRVEAFIAWQGRQNALAAEACYERAIALHAQYAPLRRWFGGFLLRIDETSRARDELEVAVSLDADRAILKLELSHANVRLKNFIFARINLANLDTSQLHRLDLKQNIEVWLQLFTNELDSYISSGDLDEAYSLVTDIGDFAVALDQRLLDVKCDVSLNRLSRQLRRFNSEERGASEASLRLIF